MYIHEDAIKIIEFFGKDQGEKIITEANGWKEYCRKEKAFYHE